MYSNIEGKSGKKKVNCEEYSLFSVTSPQQAQMLYLHFGFNSVHLKLHYKQHLAIRGQKYSKTTQQQAVIYYWPIHSVDYKPKHIILSPHCLQFVHWIKISFQRFPRGLKKKLQQSN